MLCLVVKLEKAQENGSAENSAFKCMQLHASIACTLDIHLRKVCTQ